MQDKNRKIKPSLTSGISQTALASFKYRIQGSLEHKAAYHDLTGEAFFRKIEYAWDRYKHSPAYWAVVARTELLDLLVKEYIDTHPDAVIVNLGAGLCTRFYRLDNGLLTWFEVDLPEIISLREKLGDVQDRRHQCISGSVMDSGWVEKIRYAGERPRLFIAEGLLMYFGELENRRLLRVLAHTYPGSEIFFEAISPALKRMKNIGISPKFQCALEDPRLLQEWDKRISFVNEFMIDDRAPHLLPWSRRMLQYIPVFQRMMRIVHIRFSML